MQNELDLIPVRILNGEYPIKCPPSKRIELEESSQYLDKEMRKVHNAGKIMGVDQIAVVVALNVVSKMKSIANELHDQREKNSHLSRKLQHRVQILSKKISDHLNS